MTEYYVVDENTLVYNTGRSSEFGIECAILSASIVRAKLYGKATQGSSYHSYPFGGTGNLLYLTPSMIYRKATQEDAKVFNVELPEAAK